MRVDPSPVITISCCLPTAVVDLFVALPCGENIGRQRLKILKRDLLLAPGVRQNGIWHAVGLGHEEFLEFPRVNVEESHGCCV